jgi:hypothetical protein
MGARGEVKNGHLDFDNLHMYVHGRAVDFFSTPDPGSAFAASVTSWSPKPQLSSSNRGANTIKMRNQLRDLKR